MENNTLIVELMLLILAKNKPGRELFVQYHGNIGIIDFYYYSMGCANWDDPKSEVISYTIDLNDSGSAQKLKDLIKILQIF